jgi:phosphatidylglycerophosphate synthase
MKPAGQRSRMTLRRLVGLDRSAPAPARTRAGEPLRPWTIPNAIGYARLVLLALFVVVSWEADGGISKLAAVLYAAVAGGDYLDGIAARATGQYSRLGALMDPLIDRLTVIAGAVVAWHFDLLPHWLLLLLVLREGFMLILGRMALRRRGTLAINWIGRIGVWPTMAALFFAFAGAEHLALVLLVIGVAFAYCAAVLYARDTFAAPALEPRPDHL